MRTVQFVFASIMALFLLHTHAGGQAPLPKAKGKKDVELVERLLAARKEYQLSLETLRKLYIQMGDLERARWAEEELLQYHRMVKNAFLLDLDVPPPTLKGSTNIPEANKLYREALKYKGAGWGTDFIDNQRRAELLLQKILTDYPQSSKISDTAYQLGEIYEGPANKQYRRAAAYFERCYQWNDKTHFDARMRAARLYDKQINNRTKAVEIYREVVTHETDEKRREEAQRRIQEIGGR